MKKTRAQKNYEVHSHCRRIAEELRAGPGQFADNFRIQTHLRMLRSIERLAIKGTRSDWLFPKKSVKPQTKGK
jgi:hypothetical protein